MKYCKFLLDNYHIVDNYIKEVIEEKEKVFEVLRNYKIIDSHCNWIHFNNKIDNINTIRIFNKYKVLAKFCKIPNDDRNNWCRLTIQPNMSKEKFMTELI